MKGIVLAGGSGTRLLVEYISPRALEEGAKTLCTAATWVANKPELSFEREIPEDMKRELEKYFA